jgi:hypothetical protein
LLIQARQIDAWLRYQGGQLGDEVQRRKAAPLELLVERVKPALEVFLKAGDIAAKRSAAPPVRFVALVRLGRFPGVQRRNQQGS